LEGPEDILPDVLEVGSVSEGKDRVFLVHGEDALDLDCLLFDYVGVDGFVGLIASHAGPGQGVLVSAHLQGVEDGDLLLVGDRDAEGDAEGQHCNAE
jgi:hypothetical protein